MPTSPSFFICHSSTDKPFVRQIAERLTSYGVAVWVDEGEIRVGDSLIGRIGDALQECDYIGVVLSQNSVKSEWVQRELREALHREFNEGRVVVLPILLEQTKLPAFLTDKKFADFSERSMFSDGLAGVLNALGISRSIMDGLPGVDFAFHSLRHIIQISDAGGRLSTWRKETTATPARSGITHWRDEQFHSSGNLTFVRSQPGTIESIDPDGGTVSVLTRFDSPLVPGERFTKVLEIEARDAYLEDSEDFSWIVHGRFEELIIDVTLPRDRPFLETPITSCSLSTQDTELLTLKTSDDRTHAVLSVPSPTYGAKYALRWLW